ncbi:carotenoid biosynthesis protein [Sediminitomix flava]|uniref:Putative membrane protein n=1 Tax=Sediminitomix flava TaxID=379075 RepID=A0A315Z9K9_SEDFL|nr:carotenoid biosynthesis protein [Sediminitomix flava]PWJ41879.1 putative membrane protein [Sediminitomix flava]
MSFINQISLSNKLNKVIPSLFIFYSVGIVGMYAFASLFQDLTPMTLVMTLGLLLIYHPAYNLKLVIALILVFLGGYGVEVLGVKTGVIFGEYAYGDTLGFALFDVPLMMGVNWVLMVYTTACVVEQFSNKWWTKAIFGSALMVLTDYFMEPVAMRYDFWNWADATIPFQNYLAWYIFAFLFHLVFYFLVPKINNQIGKWVWLAMAFFFGSLYLLIQVGA